MPLCKRTSVVFFHRRRCRRPKLKVMADILLKRRGGNRVPPPTLCELEEIPYESLRKLDR